MDTPDTALSIAQSRLLLPAGLDATHLERMFGTLLGPGIDFGDLYFHHSRRESWSVEDGSAGLDSPAPRKRWTKSIRVNGT